MNVTLRICQSLFAASRSFVIPNSSPFACITRGYREIQATEEEDVVTVCKFEEFIFTNIHTGNIHNLNITFDMVSTVDGGYWLIEIKGISHENIDHKEAARLVPEDPCPLRSRGLQITPEDVLILNQFITSGGDILSQSETGLCKHEYNKVISCVKMAQRSNMLPGPENDTSVSPDGKPLNTYLTRYPIGTRSPIRGRNLWYRRNYYRVGDARLVRDAPKVGRRPLMDKH